jgi:hypothetical protein
MLNTPTKQTKQERQNGSLNICELGLGQEN